MSVLRSFAIVVLLAVATLVGVPATSSSAPGGAACSDSTVVRDRISVLLVHGFVSSEGKAWSAETRRYLESGGRACVSTFDYSSVNARWVRDPAIGHDLAETVVRLGRASAAGGGTGRVVVVAHSMGGLALRCASDPSCSGGVTGVADHLRAVVTFGTPHQGSQLRGPEANLLRTVWCRSPRLTPAEVAACVVVDLLAESPAGRAFIPGSRELAELPSLPASVPVLALAGSVELTTTWWGQPKRVGSAGDLVVGEASALAVHRNRAGVGGEKAIGCGSIDLSAELVLAEAHFPGRGYRTCHHMDMTNNDAFLVEALTVITRAREQDPARRPAPVSPVTEQRLAELALPAGHWCGYASDEFAGGVRLRGGRVVDSRDSGFIDTEETVLADIDGDSVTDGLAHLICSSGAGGTTSALEALVARTGQVLEIPYGRDAERELEDLSVYRLYDIEVSSGELRLQASGHRPDDAVCCPSDEVDIVYRLGQGEPQFVSANLRTPAATQPESETGPASGQDCDSDSLTQALCDFVTAVQTGDLASLTNEEKTVAARATDLPSRAWQVGDCELEGDVTVRCEVVFPVSEANSEDTIATFYVQPTEVRFDEDGIVVPATDEYVVVSYEGLGP